MTKQTKKTAAAKTTKAAAAPTSYNDRKTVKIAEQTWNMFTALSSEFNTHNEALDYLLSLHYGKQESQTANQLKDIVRSMIEAAKEAEPSKRIIPNTNNIDLAHFEKYGKKTNLKHRKNALASFENEIKALKYR